MSDEPRKYHSPLREQRAAETREKILEAALKLLGEGAHKLTIPAVAKEAGVSVPTVYRHFGSKEELEEGLADYVREVVGFMNTFDGLDGLREQLTRTWAAAGGYPPGTLALMLATIGRKLGEEDHEGRRAYMEGCLSEDLRELDEEDRELFVTIASALASTPGGLAFRRLGLDFPEAADLISWLLETLHEALRNK